ncbi:hypothetical protein [Desulfonatronum sp. SC1]|uniref:hypothetical protein n=1 Tax=Desulfonatronum sp. SC1 TaxID=2109626 RepID=UPI000D3175EB|nr:hypothetical protein [Desulfonatronum sp. SC1]PTN32375.1 hypothetical protein C6366_16595 [Desulfonatronum sp. SC1]
MHREHKIVLTSDEETDRPLPLVAQGPRYAKDKLLRDLHALSEVGGSTLEMSTGSKSSLNVEAFNSPLKNSQLLRRYKKYKLSRMNKYASTLNFFCSLHLGFLNGLWIRTFSTLS